MSGRTASAQSPFWPEERGVSSKSLLGLICICILSTVVIFLNTLVVVSVFLDRPTVHGRHMLYTLILAAADLLVAVYTLAFSMMKWLEHSIVTDDTICSTWLIINSVSLSSSVLSLGFVLCDLGPVLNGGIEYENWVTKRKLLAMVLWLLVASVFYFHVEINIRDWSVDPGKC